MNDQELKNLWRAQKIEPAPPMDASAQIKVMQDQMSQLHRTLNARNLCEFVAAAVVIVIFGIYFFTIPYPVTRVGDLIVIGGSLFGAWKMIQCRRRTPRPDLAAPVAHWLKQERERVHHEAELLRTVQWWYLLPLWLGPNVFFWGFPGQTLWAKITYTLVTTLLGVWIYRLNQSARRKQLLPIQNELETLLQQESHAGESVQPSSAGSTRKRNHLLLSIVFLAVIGALILAWHSQRNVLPRAPGFETLNAFSSDDIAKLDAYLQEQVARAKYPSLSVAIVRHGKIVYQRAFGLENIKARRKATPQTAYHVASVTKAFTASLAAMLHARGVIDLDQPVAKYLPAGVSISANPAVGARITLRQLASHTSGLPRGVPGAVQSVEGRYQLEPKRLYDHLAGLQLEFDPGADQLYSNLAFGLLGHALERAAGKPFDQLLQELVCAPLQLERTAIHANDRFSVATGYSSPNPRREKKYSYRERFAASGGLIASAPDLAQFLAAQMKPGHFSSEMLAQLHTASKLSDGSPAHTALGWSIRFSDKAGRILHKNGGRNNCTAWIGFAPEHGVGVAIIANCGDPAVDPIGRWLLERSLGATP